MRQRKLNALKSAPVTMKDISDNSQGTIKQNDDSYASQAMKSDAESQLSTIDDYRLRQLLEELYRDKKYFDHYVDTTGRSNNFMGVQWLSGRVLDSRPSNAGSSLAGVTALCPCARTLILA